MKKINVMNINLITENADLVVVVVVVSVRKVNLKRTR